MTAIPLPPMANSVGIYVELPDSLLNFEKNIRRKLPGTLRRIAMEGKSFWKSEAGRRLKSSRNAYQKGIDFKIADDTSAYLVLEGFLPVSIENGRKGFDMKPGFLSKPSKKRKIPKAIAASLPKKPAAMRHRIIPLNVNKYINMQKPTVFRTVTDLSPADSWLHPGFKGRKIVDEVVKQLNEDIIPRHMKKMLGEV